MGSTERERLPVLDPAVVEGMSFPGDEAGKTLFDEAAAMLRASLPGQASQLRQAVEAGDAKQARALAHRLRGGAGALGAGRLAHALEVIEGALLAGKRGAHEVGLGDLEAEMHEFFEALDRRAAGR